MKRKRTRTIGPMIVAMYCGLLFAAAVGYLNHLDRAHVIHFPGVATVVVPGMWI